ADVRKSSASHPHSPCALYRVPVARCQQFLLMGISPPPDRSNRVDHILCGELIAFGRVGESGLATTQLPALVEQFRTRSPVNRTVHAPATQQRAVGGVNDRVH